MSASRHEKVSELFLQAADLQGEERSAFLDRACDGDPRLRFDIESLLRHDEPATPLLETGSMYRRARAELDWAPARIGPFRILEKIGEGGMGVVYRGEQRQPIRRQAAIKLIKRGLESRQVLRRFDSEREALARMDHPHIARVLDAGMTDEGRPFFAMEYVAGKPITEFCDAHELSVEQRLRLILQVCEAVQHAHRNAIIHRDLKPSNVLVALADGHPVPKVIDFGIAKALEQKHDEATVTQAGQMLGTLEYMSPEQATLFPHAVDTRTDVYSLGALLYELLAGSPPFDVARMGATNMDEVRRSIREDDPPSPSVRLASLGDEAIEVSRARGASPSSLRRQLRGDLDCITMKALANDRSRRYESASALAADLQRYLDHEPIEARPPGGVYRVGKLIKKHRVAAAVVAVLIPLLVGFSVTMALQAGRIARERDRAEEVSEFLVGFYDVPFFLVERHDRPSAEGVLLRSAEKIERGLSDRPRLQARLTHQMGRTLGRIGRSEGEELLERARARLEELEGPESPRALAARHDLAMARWARREPDAESLMLEALAARRAVLGDRHPDTLYAMVDAAQLYKRAHRFEESATWIELAVEGMRSALGPDHEHTEIATSLLGAVYLDLGRYDDVEAVLTALLPELAAGSRERCIAIYNLACVHAARRDRATALDLLGRAVDCGFGINFREDRHWQALLDDPDFMKLAVHVDLRGKQTLGDVFRLGKTYTDLERFDQVVTLFRTVLDSVPESVAGTNNEWRRRLCVAYLGMGNYVEAQRVIEERLDGLRRAGDWLDVAASLWYRIQAQLGRDDREGALASLDEQAEIYRRYHVSPPYPRAVRAAILGDHETAFRELHEAARRGFSDFRRLQQDLAFKELRGTPEFDAVIAEIQRRSWVPEGLDVNVLRPGSASVGMSRVSE